MLRSDGGGEFFNNNLGSFLQENGISHQKSCAYTPQQNGVVERKQRHIVEMALTLVSILSTSKFLALCLCHWPTPVYLINRLPSPSLNHNPYLNYCFILFLIILL